MVPFDASLGLEAELPVTALGNFGISKVPLNRISGKSKHPPKAQIERPNSSPHSVGSWSTHKARMTIGGKMPQIVPSAEKATKRAMDAGAITSEPDDGAPGEAGTFAVSTSTTRDGSDCLRWFRPGHGSMSLKLSAASLGRLLSHALILQ